MTDTLLVLALVLLVILLVLLVMLLRHPQTTVPDVLTTRLDVFEKILQRTEVAIRDEAGRSREELGKSARDQRLELTDAFKTSSESFLRSHSEFAAMQRAQLETFATQLAAFNQSSDGRLDGIRAESALAAKQLREEVVGTLKSLAETNTKTMGELGSVQKGQLDAFSTQLADFARSSWERLDGVRADSTTAAKQLREEVVATLKALSETNTKTMGELAVVQKNQLDVMSIAMGKLSDLNEKKLEEVRLTVECKLQSMQSDNAKQLEQMRQTVDEKLQSTLEKRLGESFKQVSERLELVHKGLGEMQSLATGVGDLKKVLTNVKTRGTWGEVQLGVLLEQVLNPDQFAANVATKGGTERVEYAVKMPGHGIDVDEVVWLPIDAKFPVEDYQRLIDAQERGDVGAVEAAGKQLESRVKACAADISAKYLSPPMTTDFGILFMPIEGLFAEVIRRTGLMEAIQRDSRVVIAGPTTLWSILNSLQMGFRTLAIQKRSSEVWNLLAAVKTEWTKYGDVLDSVQKKLHAASETLDKAKVRSRAVGRKLRDVQELPVAQANALLPLATLEDDKLDDDEGVGGL